MVSFVVSVLQYLSVYIPDVRYRPGQMFHVKPSDGQLDIETDACIPGHVSDLSGVTGGQHLSERRNVAIRHLRLSNWLHRSATLFVRQLWLKLEESLRNAARSCDHQFNFYSRMQIKTMKLK